MKGLLFCGVFLATAASLAWAAPAIPSAIAAHATELAKSVIQLTESARHNPTVEQFDAAMNELVKKYIAFEQIIAKNYVAVTGKKEDSEASFKSYYEAVDKLWHAALGDKEGRDISVEELALAAKHIAQQMVNLIPSMHLTAEHLDQLLAHGEVIFIFADEAHHLLHPEPKVNRERRHADIFWATKGHHGHHGHHHGHHGHHQGHHNNIFWAAQQGHHHGHHGHHGHHQGHHNNIFWAAQQHGHHHGHHGHHQGHHNNIFWAGHGGR